MLLKLKDSADDVRYIIDGGAKIDNRLLVPIALNCYTTAAKAIMPYMSIEQKKHVARISTCQALADLMNTAATAPKLQHKSGKYF